MWDLDILKDAIGHSFFTIVFDKVKPVDGEIVERTANAVIPKDDKYFRHSPPMPHSDKVLPFLELSKLRSGEHAWRSANLDTIKEIRIHGRSFGGAS